MRKKVVAILLIAVFMFTMVGCTGGGSKDQSLQIHGVYVGMDEILREFEESNGIKVEYVNMSSGEVLSRMRAEKGRPLADVWFGGGVDSFMVAADEGLLQPYKSPEAEFIDSMYKDEEGYWTGMSVVLITFVANKELAEQLGVEIPQSWEELTDPKYKGELIMPNPGISGTAYTSIAAILQRLGEEEGWAYLKKLDENMAYYAEQGAEPPQKTALGELLVGISPDGIVSKDDYPIEIVYPKDGTPWWHSPVAVIEGAENIEEAKIFVDWILSREGQEVMAKYDPRPSTRSDILIEGVPQLDELNLIDYDFLLAAEQRDAVIEKWNRMID